MFPHLPAVIKKRGRNFLAHPTHLAFALPFRRDKQLSQPTPIAYYK